MLRTALLLLLVGVASGGPCGPVVSGSYVRANAKHGSTCTLRGAWLEVTIGIKVFKVTDHGAKGDGKTDDTKAIQATFDAAAKAGGGTVLFPAGKTYVTGPFKFSGSNTALELPKGAVVKFANHGDSKPPEKLPGSQSGELIYIEEHSDIAIVGGGVFDGQGEHFWPYYHDPKKDGPNMLKADHSKHCLIQGVTFKDSPNHNLVMYCDHTEVDHVKILAPPSCEGCPGLDGTAGPSHNTDGVDIYGSPAYIHHCHIDVGDDNVAVHGRDLLVEDSYIGHGHGLSIGSVHSNAGVQNITFRNLVMNRTDNCAGIKTDAGSKNCHLSNVTWKNITLYDVHNVISIDMFYGHGKNETTDCPISDIKIIDVTAHGNKVVEGKKKGHGLSMGSIHCQKSCPCHGIELENVVHVDKLADSDFHCTEAYGKWKNVSPPPQNLKHDKSY